MTTTRQSSSVLLLLVLAWSAHFSHGLLLVPGQCVPLSSPCKNATANAPESLPCGEVRLAEGCHYQDGSIRCSDASTMADGNISNKEPTTALTPSATDVITCGDLATNDDCHRHGTGICSWQPLLQFHSTNGDHDTPTSSPPLPSSSNTRTFGVLLLLTTISLSMLCGCCIFSARRYGAKAIRLPWSDGTVCTNMSDEESISSSGSSSSTDDEEWSDLEEALPKDSNRQDTRIELDDPEVATEQQDAILGQDEGNTKAGDYTHVLSRAATVATTTRPSTDRGPGSTADSEIARDCQG